MKDKTYRKPWIDSTDWYRILEALEDDPTENPEYLAIAKAELRAEGKWC